MTNWKDTVKIKHLFTEESDHESVQASMKAVADELKKHQCFSGFPKKKFYSIPKGDDYFGPIDYANKLIAQMYDWADEHAIWVD